MSIEETNKALIVRYYDFLNKKGLSLEEFVDPKFVFHDPAQPDVTDFAKRPAVVSGCLRCVSRCAL